MKQLDTEIRCEQLRRKTAGIREDRRTVIMTIFRRGAQDVVDKRWSLTDDKNAHNDNEDQRHVLLEPVFTHLGSSSLPVLERVDELHVEEGDEQQRTAVDHDEVQDVGVDDAVDSIVAERADFEHFAGPVDSNAHRYAVVLRVREHKGGRRGQ